MLHRIFALAALLAGLCMPVLAQTPGTLTVALQQNVDVNGRPLSGCKLFIYVAGTIATPQSIFTDASLTTLLPNPLTCDTTGRIPMFYLGTPAVHVRLTDAGGVQIYDYPSMIVLGAPSTGGGGGGGPVDPTTIFSTGDIKFRSSLETLTGWVVLNGTTVGSAFSGASQRANADTLNLYSYLWANCADNHCPVATGRGGTAAADFNANKAIGLPDFRGRTPVGLDSMGAAPANRLVAANITSGGGDTINTPNATGGEGMHTLLLAEMPIHNHTATSVVTDPGHTHTTDAVRQIAGALATGGAAGSLAGATINSATTGVTVATTIANAGSGAAHNNMPPLMLGSWFMKL
jgi:microcystin-dependent protein